jgi:hypothetical protein
MKIPHRIFVVTIVFMLGSAAFSFGNRSSEESMFLSETRSAQRGNGRGISEEAGSDHRASAKRMWRLNMPDPTASVEAFVLRSDAVPTEGILSGSGRSRTLHVDTQPMDGSMDGIFNLYVVQRSVTEETLTIRVAKANMINHSCSWKHPYRSDRERLRAKSLISIPLEIVVDDLWDSNFHVTTMSGDRLAFRVLSYGRPAASATIALETASGWKKSVKTDKNGSAEIQLIGDYFPERWPDFDRRKTGSFLVTANYDITAEGILAGKPYHRIRMTSTLPWKYSPARQTYTSYAWGLGIGVLFAVVAGIGTFVYRERRHKPYREVQSDGQD